MGKMVKNMGTYGKTMGKMVEKWEHMGNIVKTTMENMVI